MGFFVIRKNESDLFMPDGTGERIPCPWDKRQSICYLQVWIAFVYTWFHLKEIEEGLAQSCPGDFCHLQFWMFTVIRNSEWQFFIPDFTLWELHGDALWKKSRCGWLSVSPNEPCLCLIPPWKCDAAAEKKLWDMRQHKLRKDRKNPRWKNYILWSILKH